jgi:Cft2 family RNA processing exonuclease
LTEFSVQHDRGIRITGAPFVMDATRAAACCVVSHAHSDHVARHQRMVTTRATAALIRQRCGAGKGAVTTLEYGEPWECEGWRVVLQPAGHVLGSAMVHVTSPGGATLLYTGDFKLKPGLSCEAAQPERADLLVMECTFGLPRYVFPPLEQLRARLHTFCRTALERETVPVVMGYSIGKAQEIQSLLGGEFCVAVHPAVAGMNERYAEFGYPVPPWEPAGPDLEGRVLVMPPAAGKSDSLAAIPRKSLCMVSGWGLDPSARYQYGVDEVLPLSDHADFPDLLRMVKLVQPRRVLTTHGWHRQFAATLRAKGVEAWSLHGSDQLELFSDADFDIPSDEPVIPS